LIDRRALLKDLQSRVKILEALVLRGDVGRVADHDVIAPVTQDVGMLVQVLDGVLERGHLLHVAVAVDGELPVPDQRVANREVQRECVVSGLV
jgi:hypothetical protein